MVVTSQILARWVAVSMGGKVLVGSRSRSPGQGRLEVGSMVGEVLVGKAPYLGRWAVGSKVGEVFFVPFHFPQELACSGRVQGRLEVGSMGDEVFFAGRSLSLE